MIKFLNTEIIIFQKLFKLYKWILSIKQILMKEILAITE